MGLVLTHAHEDHFGAIIDLWPKLKCPIYATQFSAALFEAKCAAERNPPKIPITVVPSGGRIDLGPFSVEFIPVAGFRFRNRMRWRSIPWPARCSTPATGRSIPPRSSGCRPTSGGCASLAMPACWHWSAIPPMRCVTGARRRRSTEVAATITKLVKAAKGRVAVTTFASNVARVRAVADAAKAAGREVVVVGRAMERVVQVAREMRLSRRRAEFPRCRSLRPLPARQGAGAVHRQAG